MASLAGLAAEPPPPPFPLLPPPLAVMTIAISTAATARTMTAVRAFTGRMLRRRAAGQGGSLEVALDLVRVLFSELGVVRVPADLVGQQQRRGGQRGHEEQRGHGQRGPPQRAPGAQRGQR